MSYYKEIIVREWSTTLGQSDTYRVKVEVTPLGGRKVQISNAYNGDQITATLTLEETRAFADLLRESVEWNK